MNALQEEFEKTGYTSWINSDIYPNGKIHTQEYVNWLETRLLKILAASEGGWVLHSVVVSTECLTIKLI